MPVINPWIFYTIEIINNLSAILIIILTILLVVLLVFGLSILNMLPDRDLFDDELKRVKKKFKRLMKIFVLVIVLCALIPSKETMYAMLIAENVTYENLDKAAKVIQDSVDYIFEKIGGEDQNYD